MFQRNQLGKQQCMIGTQYFEFLEKKFDALMDCNFKAKQNWDQKADIRYIKTLGFFVFDEKNIPS